MLLTARYAFFHMPKTGGMWVRQVIRSSGVFCYEGGTHLLPGEVLPVLPGRYSFTFTRHPVTWWRSLWAYSAAHGWPSSAQPFHRIIGCCLWPSYAEFMDRVLNDIPGEYSRITARYTGGVTRVGRTENLAADLARFLTEAGVPLAAAPAAPPANTGQYGPLSASTPQIDAGIIRAEADIISRFYQDQP